MIVGSATVGYFELSDCRNWLRLFVRIYTVNADVWCKSVFLPSSIDDHPTRSHCVNCCLSCWIAEVTSPILNIFLGCFDSFLVMKSVRLTAIRLPRSCKLAAISIAIGYDDQTAHSKQFADAVVQQCQRTKRTLVKSLPSCLAIDSRVCLRREWWVRVVRVVARGSVPFRKCCQLERFWESPKESLREPSSELDKHTKLTERFGVLSIAQQMHRTR